MRVITRKRLEEYGRKHPDARASLFAWHEVARRERWQSIVDGRRAFPAADAATVKSGRTATIFNIRGNNYRLIVAIHFNTQVVYVMRFLTHAAYDKEGWKETL
jgi:mRNA interferase HigB